MLTIVIVGVMSPLTKESSTAVTVKVKAWNHWLLANTTGLVSIVTLSGAFVLIANETWQGGPGSEQIIGSSSVTCTTWLCPSVKLTEAGLKLIFAAEATSGSSNIVNAITNIVPKYRLTIRIIVPDKRITRHTG